MRETKEQKIIRLENKVDELETSIKEIKKGNREYVRGLKSEIKGLTSQLEKQTSENENFSSSVEKLQKEYDTLKLEYNDLYRMYKEYDSRIRGYEELHDNFFLDRLNYFMAGALADSGAFTFFDRKTLIIKIHPLNGGYISDIRKKEALEMLMKEEMYKESLKIVEENRYLEETDKIWDFIAIVDREGRKLLPRYIDIFFPQEPIGY